MGIFSNVSEQGVISYLIRNHSSKLSVLSYLAGITWFLLLAWEPNNSRTYFSENALLPGLVQREFQLGNVASQLYETLKDEADSQNGIPYGYLQAQFRKLGLELYFHNFTLNYPFGSKEVHHGQNIYAILRAPRSASLEALVLSTPYRDQSNIHGSTLPSISLMIALAKFFREQVYWAKDIIFLITDHELIGFQAWIEAYHNPQSNGENQGRVLDHGSLLGRSGSIQAAINLEIPADQLSHVDIRIEGLNGQLPNLDLLNLVVEICTRESVIPTFHDTPNPVETTSWEGWKKAAKTMFSMMLTQSMGAPSGGHGLFHRYAIQALTLRGEPHKYDMPKATFTQMGRVIEGTFRSLNNLLERFHQSFFFYLLPAARRYVSIGMYMPAFALISAPLLLKALSLYLSLDKDSIADITSIKKHKPGTSLWLALPSVIFTHFIGFVISQFPIMSDLAAIHIGMSFKDTLYAGLLAFMFIAEILILPAFLTRKSKSKEKIAFKCVALLALAMFIYTLALINISMATFVALVYVPFATTASSFSYRILRWIHRLLLFLIQPLVFTFLVILAYSVLVQNDNPPLPFKDHLKLSLEGHKKLLLWNVEDWHLYGSHNFLAFSCIFTPAWLQFWYLQ